jgi:hypothetical protein
MCTEKQHQQILHTKNNFQKQHEDKNINHEYEDAMDENLKCQHMMSFYPVLFLQ